MDPILENALRRRDAIREQIRHLQQELEKMEQFVETARILAEDSDPPTLPLPLEEPMETNIISTKMGDGVQKSIELPVDDAKPLRRPRTRANPEPARVMEEVVKILGASDAPMTRTQILTALEKRGLQIRGHDPAKVLGTNIWRYMNRTQAIAQSGDGYHLANNSS